jgi:hypothetical protein
MMENLKLRTIKWRFHHIQIIIGVSSSQTGKITEKKKYYYGHFFFSEAKQCNNLKPQKMCISDREILLIIKIDGK